MRLAVRLEGPQWQPAAIGRQERPRTVITVWWGWQSSRFGMPFCRLLRHNTTYSVSAVQICYTLVETVRKFLNSLLVDGSFGCVLVRLTLQTIWCDLLLFVAGSDCYMLPPTTLISPEPHCGLLAHWNHSPWLLIFFLQCVASDPLLSAKSYWRSRNSCRHPSLFLWCIVILLQYNRSHKVA